MQTAHRCPVRGYLPQGTRPHINLFQVRYTSPVLAASGALLGQHLRVYYNSDDMRTVRAFLADGTELGVLKAQGAWGEICHDLKLRREIILSLPYLLKFAYLIAAQISYQLSP